MKWRGRLSLGAALGGCGNPSASNPPELWLAPQGDGNELHVQLAPIQPNPF